MSHGAPLVSRQQRRRIRLDPNGRPCPLMHEEAHQRARKQQKAGQHPKKCVVYQARGKAPRSGSRAARCRYTFDHGSFEESCILRRSQSDCITSLPSAT
jgi:hypothetical protein